MTLRHYNYKKRQYDYIPTWTDPVQLPPKKKLIQGETLNSMLSSHANQGYVNYVNAGGTQITFPALGANNCAVFGEVNFVIVYGQSIGKGVDDWNDGDYAGFAVFYVSQVGCFRASSSFNEGYGGSEPYTINMAAKPVVAYKIQKAMCIELAKHGWRYWGEYSGSCYPLSQNSTMSNSENYRNMILGTADADQRCYDALRGQPQAGNPNLQWLGDPTFSTDLHLYKDILLDNYFEPSSFFNSADAYILAMCLSGIIVRGALRHLNNTTSIIGYYGYAQKAQEYNTQFFERKLPDDVGGKFIGAHWISWDLSLNFDSSLFAWLYGDENHLWIENTQLSGTNPRVIRNQNFPYQDYKTGDGPGSKDPVRKDAPYIFEPNVEHGYQDTPIPAHDLPKEAARCMYKMYQVVGNTNLTYFPVRRGTTGAFGKSNHEALLDAFQQKSAFAVGFSNNDKVCAYQLFSFSESKDAEDFQVMTTGGVAVTETVAAVTGKQGFNVN